MAKKVKKVVKLRKSVRSKKHDDMLPNIPKERNPQDVTMRNIKPSRNRLDILEARVDRLYRHVYGTDEAAEKAKEVQ